MRKKSTSTAKRSPTKGSLILKKLQTKNGATIADLVAATGWQAHSVRGFLSGTVKKRMNLNVVSTVGSDSVRRYRIGKADTAGSR